MIEWGWPVYGMLLLMWALFVIPFVHRAFDDIRQADEETMRRWADLLDRQEKDIAERKRRLGL